MFQTYLDFEKPIAELEGKVHELRQMAARDAGLDIREEVTRLETKAAQLLKDTYAKLTPWQKTQVARHPHRPHFTDYVQRLITDFTPLAGDRCFADDAALIAGFGRFKGEPVALIGQEKGADTQGRVKHNFGMAMPEGYRKAVRVMELADRFGLPVLTFVDTPGAYPGLEAEERGQAEAIARSTEMCLRIGAPIVATIIGEGGSGGAVAIATGDHVMMLENAVYSVISPEGCASILWHASERAQDAATALKLTAQDLKALGVIDEIVPEPVGGAQRKPAQVMNETGQAIARALRVLGPRSPDERRRTRREKFLAIGRIKPEV